MPTFDFDRAIDRRGTGALKWELFPGDDLLPYWVADMDFVSPPAVLEALRARVDHGVFGYAMAPASATEAALDYLRDRHGVAAEREWIVWLPGLVPALGMACRAAMATATATAGAGGGSALINTPVYPPFLHAHGEAPPMDLVKVPLAAEPLPGDRIRYGIDFAAMEQAAAAHPLRADIFCNPHNPVGRVFTEAEVREAAAFCGRHDMLFISDEIHCDLIYDEARTPHFCAAKLGGDLAARTVTLLAASKTYNIAGLGCAYAVIPDASLRRRFTRYLGSHGGFVPEVNALGYCATEAAYRHGEPWRRDLIEYLDANRRALEEFAAAKLPGVPLAQIEATYLAWFDLRPSGIENPAAHLREHARIIVSDGANFGAPGFARFNFGCPRAMMLEGLERMARAVDGTLI
ncbi:MAG: PatB family C-S lyase [Verrucomicrobiales bacterium]